MIFRGERIRLTQFGQNNHPEFSSRDRSQHALHSEISLAVLAYNMKRMIKIVGMQGMLRAITA